MKPVRDLFVRVQFDRRAADGPEELALELAACGVEKGPAYCLRRSINNRGIHS
jgi:hypothetical protein